MKNITVLPAAGLATRMRGLPKFLLPFDSTYETLIERHVRLSLEVSDMVWIPTRPHFIPLLVALGLETDRVVLSGIETKTMSETVLKVVSLLQSERFTIIMPDTFFAGDTPYSSLSEAKAAIFVALWKIRDEQFGKLGQVQIDAEGTVVDHMDKAQDCGFPHSWGAMSFAREAVRFIDPDDPHTGYMLSHALKEKVTIRSSVFSGEFFDCGTPSEYLSLIRSQWVGD